MDRSALRTQMPSLVAGHVPSNMRTFSYRVFDAVFEPSSLGFHIDPTPFQGTVIAKTEEAIVIKISRAVFAVLDHHLVSEDPDEGSKVEVTPYARRHFDGRRTDTPIEDTRQRLDGTPFTTRTIVLGGNPTRLPLPTPRCPELAALIEQIETLPAPDGMRRIAHLLVDAGARDFYSHDPLPDDIVRMPPAIHFTVASAKFEGQVTVLYERALDLYAIELHCNDMRVRRQNHIDVSSLGEALHRLIDDGQWRIIKINVLSPPNSRVRHTPKRSATH